MKARHLVAAALLVAIGAGVYWVYDSFERVPAKQWVGPSGEARLNPFLAAERLAVRMGMRSRELRSLPQLDAQTPDGVLLMPNHRQALDAARIGRLLAWVGAGGHLIVEAEFPGVSDPLFDALGVAREAGKVLEKPLAVEVQGRKLAVSFFDATALKPKAGTTPRLRGGDKLYSFQRGKGFVTAATSLHFARNALIGQHDNAVFFWTLATLTPAAELRVYFRPERLSLWDFLARNALPALVATGLLLFAWLWRIAPRFGPVPPDLPPARRRLLDHLRASGRYFWAKGLRNRLVVAARDAALWRLARAQPDFAVAPQKERVERLSNLIGISQEEAARFLAAAGQMRGADFIRVTQHAQRIHSALEKGDK
jgi:hypothetical protein